MREKIKEMLKRNLSQIIKKFKIIKIIKKIIAIVVYEVKIDVINIKNRE